MKTVTRIESYKGHPLIKIYAADDMGQPTGKNIVSFGTRKAQAIVDNIPAIQEFIKNYSKARTADQVDLDALSEEQKNQLLAKLLAQ